MNNSELENAQKFIKGVSQVLKENRVESSHYNSIVGKEQQMQLLNHVQNIKSFTATSRVGDGNTPENGSGFLQTVPTKIKVFNIREDLIGTIMSKGYNFAQDGNLLGRIATSKGYGYSVEVPTINFNEGTRFKPISEAMNFDDPLTKKGLASYILDGYRYGVKLPFHTIQGISANHTLTDFYEIYRQQDPQERASLMTQILINSLIDPQILSTVTAEDDPSFPIIKTIFTLSDRLFEQGSIERTAILLNYGMATKLKNELMSANVRTHNFGSSASAKAIETGNFSVESGGGVYFGQIGAVDIFRTREIKNNYSESAGQIGPVVPDTDTSTARHTAIIAFDPNAVTNHMGSEDLNKFVVETDEVRSIMDGNKKLASVVYAGGTVLEPSRVDYSLFQTN